MILTSVGLEVEKMENFEEVKGGLKGLVIGEVLEAQQHPNADKLKLTRVNTGGEPLQIVCGAPNVAAGQKVVVATVGTTIYPSAGDALTMKVAKIRGVESHGMICAEDEIGLGSSHAGIMVLPADVQVGMKAEEYFKPYNDVIYEIGLTPNRMDAMSHLGVARDVCAYLSHHEQKDYQPVFPEVKFEPAGEQLSINISIENQDACKRYSGVCIAGVKVAPSPKWLQERLKSIGLRPINNIVDITNFIQHETGQPLHAFDYDAISDHTIIVKTLPEGSTFVTLDEKERKLNQDDLMICDARGPMCIAGVFGGLHSGVTEKTKNIFIESAWFDPVFIRKTSFRHGLRTDAATRFEKGIDISNTVNVAKRAAQMITEITGGSIASGMYDVYPDPETKKRVRLTYAYLKKLSGKTYSPASVKKILESLGFVMVNESNESIEMEVPYHKPDIAIPADVVEEILRIDGLDHVEIPTTISISPSVEVNYKQEVLKEKTSGLLTGLGFTEILTNSITNSAYYSHDTLQTTVKLLNNLSNELNIMRPSMLQTALEVISFNINRKNLNLRLFEFGKTYSTASSGDYREAQHLCLFLSGHSSAPHWKNRSTPADLFDLKGIAESLVKNFGIEAGFAPGTTPEMKEALVMEVNGERIVELGQVNKEIAGKFDIRQAVFYADFHWDVVLKYAGRQVRFKEISKFPSVERDLAVIVSNNMKFAEIEQSISKLKLNRLQGLRLFDVFESEKLGSGKKSLAINLTFLDEEKTLTDKEIDGWMNRIMTTLEKDLQAEIRKQ